MLDPRGDMTDRPDDSIVVTGRLNIRRLRDSDAALIQPLANNWEIARQTAELPFPYTLDDAARLIEASYVSAKTGKELVFAIVTRESDTLIGLMGLVLDCAPIEAGYWIGAPYWGNGYASEALGALRDYAVRRFSCSYLDAVAFDDNLGSIRVLTKCGFRHFEDTQLDFPTRGGARTVSHYRWRA